MAKKAKKGDAAGIAAIRIWAMAIETAMIKRYIGNAPTLEPIKAIALRTVKEIQKIKPAMLSDCDSTWRHLPDCTCDPTDSSI